MSIKDTVSADNLVKKSRRLGFIFSLKERDASKKISMDLVLDFCPLCTLCPFVSFVYLMPFEHLVPFVHCSQPDALKQLVAVYVGRSFVCWKEPEVVTWLERNVKSVLARVDQQDPLVQECARK